MRTSVVLAVSFLTGCASLDAADCGSAYDLGFRDAIFGLQRQDDLYRPLCSRRGVELDVPRYAQGWREGVYEFDQRKNHSGVE
jgi:hypothetical protein